LQRAVLWCLHPAGERTAHDSPSHPSGSAPPPPSPTVERIVIPTIDGRIGVARDGSDTVSELLAAAGDTAVSRPQVTARLLGPFELTIDGTAVVDWHGRLGPLVLRFVLGQPGRRCSRDMLLDQFWPYTDPARARNRLHVAISSLRRAVKVHGVPILEHHDGWYRISPAVDLSLDTDEFDRLREDAERCHRRGDAEGELHALRAAVDLYRGDYLADLPYEEWALSERESYRMALLRTLERLATLALEHGRVADALDAAGRLVRADPCREDAHRVLMRCHAQQRRLGEVVRQFEACRRSLAGLGVSPSPETIQLYRSLRGGLAIGCELSPTG